MAVFNVRNYIQKEQNIFACKPVYNQVSTGFIYASPYTTAAQTRVIIKGHQCFGQIARKLFIGLFIQPV
ncbi:Uncharacterised protein [Serratia marcescens]|nr:Uncharacterised protein [Serratia marcescens]